MPSLIAAAASPLCSAPAFVSLLDLPSSFPSSLSVCRPNFKFGAVSLDMRTRDWCAASDRSGFVARCSKNSDFDLEAEIMEFMRRSGDPRMFPTKKQLIDCGRKDLVDAIVAQGGWLSFGWDSDAEEGLTFHDDFDFRTLLRNEQRGLSSLRSNPSPPPLHSEVVSQESSSDESSGVEGILSRLEKERNITFGVGLRDKGVNHSVPNNKERHYCSQDTQADETVARYERRLDAASLSFSNGTVSSLGAEVSPTENSSVVNDFTNTHQTDQWRTWSSQRSGFSNEDFEAGEVHAVRIQGGGSRKGLSDHDEAREGHSENFGKTKYSNSPSPRRKIGSDQIKGRLQHLETELSSVLQSLRSKANSDDPKDRKSVPEDLQELSDAWEFQENEIMHAQDKLRSIRAKLAVLEGKMALSIIDAKKTIEQKQKRIDEARRAQRLLRDACIVWHNPANEVLLSGSFDGWASQRKMEKSNSGIFSICLKLYPGRYEIKFIVDGVWKIDPLRPIVNNNGFENNLIIIT